MCLLKIKTQEKRNEVNNASSSGSAGSAAVITAIKHASGARMPGAGVSITRGSEQARRLQSKGRHLPEPHCVPGSALSILQPDLLQSSQWPI